MGYYNVQPGDTVTLTAGEDLTGDEMKVAKGNGTDDQVVLATTVAATDPILGVVYAGAASGLPVTIQHSGIAKCKAGGTINAGAPVTNDAAGLVVAPPAGTALKYILGYALQDASSGDVIPVLVKPAPYNAGTT